MFELRLRLAFVLLQQTETELKEYGQSIIDQLIQQTQALNVDSFIVRQDWAVAEKYRDPNSWNALTDLDIKELFDHIAPLMTESDQDEMAKRFDALMLDLELSVLNNERKQVTLIQKVIDTAGKLSKKASIPSVAQKMDLIHAIQSSTYWEGATVLAIERIRIDLRELIKFLDFEQTKTVYTDFEDEISTGMKEHPLVLKYNNLNTYRKKVERFLKEHSHHLTIHKIRNNLPITMGEINALEQILFEQGSLGSKEEFIKVYGIQPLGKFIRSILGLEVNAAKQAFAEILNNQTLNSQQIRFMDTIIDFLTAKGMIEPKMLFDSPFTDINTSGIAGVFDEEMSVRIIGLLEGINRNVEVG